MSEIKFNGRVAIVTGAGAGLGRTYALELGKRGAKVVVNDLGGARDGTGKSSDAADKVVADIKAAGGEAVANYDSVASAAGGNNIVKTAVDKFGKVDIVINNAGILRDKSFIKMTEEEWDIVLAVHLKGTYNVTKAAWPIMRDNAYGRIVFTTSTSGVYGNFGQTNYGAAKMGMVGFMNCLALEGGKYNINVNCLAPTAASRLTEDVIPPDFFDKLKPEHVTPLVAYIVSEDCKDTGMIYTCALNWYSRSAIVCSKGAKIGDASVPATVEQIRDNWSKVNELKDPKELKAGSEIFGVIMS